MPPQRRAVLNVNDRMTAFKEYKRRTGVWPVFSVVLHVARFVLMFAAVSFLFWYGRRPGASVNQITLGFLLVSLPAILLWTLLESVIWNYELRRKQLTSRGTFLTIKQFPGE